MSSVNQVHLLGNVGREPEIRHTQSGDPIANLSIATSERWNDRRTGEKQERTEWHRVVVFGPLAKIVEQYVGKGSRIYVQGKLKTRKWQDRDGNDRYSTEVVLSGFQAHLVLIDRPKDGGNQAESRPAGYQASAQRPNTLPDDDLDDEVPF